MKKVPQIAILNGPSHGWGQQLFSGILAYASEHGPWDMWINIEAPKIFDEIPKDWKGDGLIARVVSANLAEELNASGLPVVNVGDNDIAGFSAPTIRTDDLVGCQLALEHFRVRGLSHFAYAGPWFTPNQKQHSETFKAVCAEENYECHIYETRPINEETFQMLCQWLVSLPKPVGLLVLGNEQGREIVNACRHLGIDVPHDVAVLSCSYDELMSNSCFPALSGLQAPAKQIGYQAAGLIHRMLEGESVPHDTIYLPPRGIVERLSTETLAVNDPKLEEVMEFINEHAFESFTMTDVLKAVPMSRRTLERHFYDAIGRTIFDEVRRIRVNKARRLLVDTDMDMQAIAEACGFNTYNYLSNTFKKVARMSLRDYRKQNRV